MVGFAARDRNIYIIRKKEIAGELAKEAEENRAQAEEDCSRNSLLTQTPEKGSHRRLSMQKHRRIVPLEEGSALHVALDPASQSAWVPHTGSLGDAHCSSTPARSPHCATGVPTASRFTKLRMALQPVPLARME